MPDKIPHPEFTSWMHERCELPVDTLADRYERWKQQPVPIIALEAVASRIIKATGMFSGIRAIVAFKLLMRVFRLYFKAFNKLTWRGVENIPKSGCIFYVNHPGSYDPLYVFACVPDMPFAMFVAWGNGWFADTIADVYGMTNMRGLSRQGAIEKMIRLILQKNKYFALWPEGHPHRGPIEQGFSAIVPVYAAINHDKDRIPFLPVLIRGEGAHRFGVSHVAGPVGVTFYKPIFLDRSWLKRPEEGGKTPREIIDYLMMFLAKKNGQKELAKNTRLEWSRAFHQNSAKFEAALEHLKVTIPNELSSCDYCKVIENTKRGEKPPLIGEHLQHFVDDPTGIHHIVQCSHCGSCYDIASREGKTYITKLKGSKAFKKAVLHVLAQHGGKFKEN
ncbi:MAG: lysophospholipid acyltransferase family protein [Candidatus Sigynarchaeota archaeon]